MGLAPFEGGAGFRGNGATGDNLAWRQGKRGAAARRLALACLWLGAACSEELPAQSPPLRMARSCSTGLHSRLLLRTGESAGPPRALWARRGGRADRAQLEPAIAAVLPLRRRCGSRHRLREGQMGQIGIIVARAHGHLSLGPYL
jgi:hypothetical protein